ncbi:Mss4-like protein [Daldinia decipiens]|uniref:Mss4-like protein n=1 Tax=Daldinia decipiens TaxID=326647 RepID=UPI0020C22E47|nr:Mss4-like protein [Daldinia decipiens]KAI1658924.1 Mss4-like protein [Daldinia decipiens]
MLKLRVLPSRTWRSSLRRHHSRCAKTPSTPSPLIPTTAYPAQYSRLKPSPLSKIEFHSTRKNMGQTRSETETGAETGAVRDSIEDWKSKPPYRTTPGNEHFDKKWTAHCHCGRVKYWLSRDKPLSVKFCHCVDCQALHGAPFQWAAIFEKQDLHFEKGAEGLAFYHSPDKSTVHRLPCKVSCAYCHSPIMDEGRNMVLLFPGIIKFSDAEHKKLFDPQ